MQVAHKGFDEGLEGFRTPIVILIIRILIPYVLVRQFMEYFNNINYNVSVFMTE